MSCPDCDRDLDHCHGALVRMPDGSLECSEPECHDLGGDRHALQAPAEPRSTRTR